MPLDASLQLGVPLVFYASKSFLDPAGGGGSSSSSSSSSSGEGGGGRRIFWGWAIVAPASAQTLPRLATYHAALQQLVWSPLPELTALRAASLYYAPSLAIPAGSAALLCAGLPPGAANRSELLLSFALPGAGQAVAFGVSLWPQGYAGAAPPLTLAVAYSPASHTANLSLAPSYYMPGVDMPGGDMSVSNENYTDPHLCQAACSASPQCLGYTWVVRPPLAGACCLKSSLLPPKGDARCTSGVKPGAAAFSSAHAAPIPLLPGDAALDLRLFVDSTVLEVYAMQGRLAATLQLQGVTDLQLKVEALAGQAAVSSVELYALGSIWVGQQQVLDSRRP